ncbi:triple QxxK/R motif-containing protein-like [Branchiostoma lanceolatum]|uniref:Triple QxxK/R motif-containing protein n=1 Tax=Branchiostoma lanceolatum TaxID=7740 RepID=A0A8K0EY10_BRALA|nr:TRIQK [Branchiostoma lanceolatum]
MGRKEVSSGTLNVDQYRKKIGKQDWKKAKKDVKATKQQKDMKESAMGIKDVALIVTAFAFMLGVIYIFLYMYLDQQPSAK